MRAAGWGAAAAAAMWVAVLAWADDGAVAQVFRYETGFDAKGVPLTVPAIDPSGLAWHEPSGRLFLVDSEIDEVASAFAIVGANVFEISIEGDVLYDSYDITPLGTTEPTGIVYNPVDDRFYTTDDHTRRVTRYVFTPGVGFAVDDMVDTLATAGSNDPEGITVDPATGLLYVVDGTGRLIVTYAYDAKLGFVLDAVVDLNMTFPPGEAPNDPEGIAYDAETGNLLIISHFLTDQTLYEVTTAGIPVVTYDLEELDPEGIALRGITLAPASDLPGGPTSGLFLADGGVDNDDDPDERDGAVTIADLNRPPRFDPVADPSADEGSEVMVNLTVADLDPEDVQSFELIGTPPPGAAVDPISGVLTWTPGEAHGPGSALISVRVTDDAAAPLTDEIGVVVAVAEVNEPPAVEPIGDIVVGPEEQVGFVAVADDPDLLPALGADLVAHWPLDAVFRSSTGAHDATVTGGMTIATMPGDFVTGTGATEFDGIDDWLIYDPVSLPGDFTAAAWVLPFNIAAKSASEAVVFGDLANEDWIRLEADGVRIKFDDDRRLVPTDPDFVNAIWQHLVVTRAAGTVTVYRDGLAVGTLDHPLPFTPTLLGRKEPTTDRYAGFMDDVALWARSLDAGEVATLYDDGAGRAVDDAGTVPANQVTFSLEGDVPPGATIDPVTGAFDFTAPPGSGSWTFAVRATDDAPVPAFGEETVTLTVEIPCPADLDDDGLVGIGDLLLLLAAWGAAGPADLDEDGSVGITDLLLLLEQWGPCPT